MAEQMQRCKRCNHWKPTDDFQAPRETGKLFYKSCARCRAQSREGCRKSRAKRGGLANPDGVVAVRPPPQSVAQANVNTQNTAMEITPTTIAAQFITPPQLFEVMQPEGKHSCSLTINSHVVQETAQGIITTTVMTMMTTTARTTETSIQAEEDPVSDHGRTSDIKIEDEDEDEDEDAISELGSLPSEKYSVQQGMFLCLHCETPRPMSMAVMSTCVSCVNEWKLCEKCDCQRPRVEFKWKDEEHDECSACYFSF